MTTPAVEVGMKSAGPEGANAAPEYESSSSGLKKLIRPFMLEDYVDAVLAHHALSDPENAEPISWEQLKERLGL